MEELKRLAVITGCDSGIGRALCEIFLDAGYTTLVSVLRSNPFNNKKNCIVRHMDLRNENEIGDFAAAAKGLCGNGYSLEILVQNAGAACFGPVENLPMEMYRDIFEVNFFGLISLTQKLIPELIRSRGRILINGSLAGRIALPFFSPYASSKFALEGFCESLRRELKPFGIKTIMIEPGSVATPIWNSGLEQDISFTDDKYRKSLIANRDKMISGGNNGLPLEKAADQIYRILKRRNPGARYIISKRGKIDALIVSLPKRLIDFLISKIFYLDYKE